MAELPQKGIPEAPQLARNCERGGRTLFKILSLSVDGEGPHTPSQKFERIVGKARIAALQIETKCLPKNPRLDEHEEVKTCKKDRIKYYF